MDISSAMWHVGFLESLPSKNVTVKTTAGCGNKPTGSLEGVPDGP